MIGKHRLACADQIGQQAAPRAAWIAVEDALIGQIMWRRGAGLAAEGGRIHDQQVPIADSGQESQRVGTGLLLERGKQGRCFLGGNVAGRKVAHDLVLNGDQVATYGPIAAFQSDALCGSFQRSTARIMGERIIAQQAQVGRIGPGGQSGGV